MPSSQTIVIGAGNVGLLLLKTLSRGMSITCIDSNQEALAEAEKIYGSGLVGHAGDATSRLVLEEAGVGSADTVVITTTTEKINLEIARVLHTAFRVNRIISIGITRRGIAEMEELGVEVENIFNVSALGLRNRLEQKSRTVQGIGLGQNEILEIEVHPNSRLVNKPLNVLNPRRWRIGIIYREGAILVPGGDTVLKPRDRVVVLGEPTVMKTISELLRFRFEHFPLEYGNTTIVFVGDEEMEDYLAEVDYLFSVFPLKKAVFVCHSKREQKLKQGLIEFTRQHGLEEIAVQVIDLPPLEAVDRVVQNSLWRAGMLVLPKRGMLDGVLPFAPQWKRKRLLLDLARTGACPILLARGTHPYGRAAVPAVQAADLQASLQTAVEMAATLNFSIDALLTRISEYIISEEEKGNYERMKKQISEIAYVHATPIGILEHQGNPIVEMTRSLSEYGLMVIHMAGCQKGGFFEGLFRPDILWQLVRRSEISTLLLPPVEAGV